MNVMPTLVLLVALGLSIHMLIKTAYVKQYNWSMKNKYYSNFLYDNEWHANSGPLGGPGTLHPCVKVIHKDVKPFLNETVKKICFHVDL